MKTIIFILLLFSKTVFCQEVWLHENLPFPQRPADISIFKYIEKADSLWSKYKSDSNQIVHVDFSNNRSIILNYSPAGKGSRLTEFYEDTVAIAFWVTDDDSVYNVNEYESFLGMKSYEEYYYPNDSTIEYWYYEKDEILKRILKIKTGKNLMTIQDTLFKNYIGYMNTKIFSNYNGMWILKQEKETIDK